ncbi:MAG: peptidylprolyl isomerase [Granulosicoccus sp.]|nr:peptidylprolyl isomerase [Granulosicoccus sp.]
MQIENNRVVTFHYDLHEKDAALLETSRDSEPVLYLHGHQNIMQSLSEVMDGKAAGDQFEADIPPERGYGLRKEDALQRVPLKRISSAKRKTPRVGEVVSISTPQGQKSATVVKMGKFNVDVDTNHPFAGKHLVFQIEIIDVREASEEERAHGHAHGPGGHQH